MTRHRAVAEPHVVPDPRVVARGDQCSAADDEAIDQDGHAELCCAAHGADDGGDLATTQSPQYLEWCDGVCCSVERPRNRSRFA